MITIEKYTDARRDEILETWEQSVRATHHFVTPEDLEEIKELVHTIDFKQLQVFCLIQNGKLAGFIGVAAYKIEMLFLHPHHIGKGYGKKLLQYAIHQLAADKVDVNEQNLHAVNFYRYAGFEVYERTEKDDQGKSYPLLRMQLKYAAAL
ncbi:putative acetyltransferase [Filimonas zeae]|uniref:N-acetyltransferase domain-containing protein n=1 Tax=Filimonas zeae TaxID=1737353 RepID=A0A917MWK7_9BACT|nr:GNAT family N-acetyltransferase [Filimonas zeae]MDR6340090.1 putative acetyltransferase [Filimonas zeae]GGH71086.1 hypothetical protein GCM10011379_30060 [Filimonas zeae]